MTRKLISALLALLLCVTLAVSVCAAPSADFLYDQADLLSQVEEEVLAQKLMQISNTYGAQIVVVTVASSEGTDTDTLVNTCYDHNGFGYGENHDGVLLLICMDPREYRILSNGFAADAITLGRIDAIGEAIVSDLSDGNYAAAFDEFADQCEYYLNGHINGFPFQFGKNLLICLVIGIAVGLIVAFALKAQLKSVHRQHGANVYVKPGSMQVNVRSDLFLYRNVTRTKRESSSSRGSSGGGGSRNVGGGSF